MKEIIEEKGVRATIDYEIIDQNKFDKQFKKELINATGINYDWSCLIYTLEQAEKEASTIKSSLEDENAYSLINIWITQLAYKKLADEFKDGTRKSDYESYKEQQEDLDEERKNMYE